MAEDPAPIAQGALPNPLLAAAFEALDRAGPAWCLLRGADELASPAGDVDLLVSARDLRGVEEALAPLGFARSLRGVTGRTASSSTTREATGG